jgi:hypothetical protein
MVGRRFTRAGRLSAFGAVAVVAFSALGLSAAVASPSKASRPATDPGTYGGNSNGHAFTFFVPPGSSSVVDISMPVSGLICSPSGRGVNDTTFVIAKTALSHDGSFSAQASQDGFFAGAATRFSYSVAGRFSKATKQHAATAAGTLREELRYTNRAGVQHVCTTKGRSWTATRSGPIPKANSLVKPGNYAGFGNTRALGFAVKGSKVSNIYIPEVGLGCVPGGSVVGDATFNLARTTIGSDASFSIHTTRKGTYVGAHATFTYFFSGDFQGSNANGVGVAAGTFREDIAYTTKKGVHRTCTTNTVPWTAARTS